MLIRKIMRRIRLELSVPPEKLFPLRPALPVHRGFVTGADLAVHLNL
jgi:hypothetical protein